MPLFLYLFYHLTGGYSQNVGLCRGSCPHETHCYDEMMHKEFLKEWFVGTGNYIRVRPRGLKKNTVYFSLILEETIKNIIPIDIGITDKKYVPKLVLADSPSISGSLIAEQKIIKAIPQKINNAPAITVAAFQNFINKFIESLSHQH